MPKSIPKQPLTPIFCIICQHLEVEPPISYKDAYTWTLTQVMWKLGGCFKKEYGDPYKISTAYLNKILCWALIRYDDSQGLKRNAGLLWGHARSWSCLNMRSVVSKLPASLQSKWRDQVLKKKRKEDGVIRFAEVAEFVEYALLTLTHTSMRNYPQAKWQIPINLTTQQMQSCQ